MGKGGGSAPSQPSTTTQIADIPEWERPYVEDLLGQAQAVAAQPYQQYQGPQIAGFTPDQLQAFQNIQGAGATNQTNQAAAFDAAGAGANTANGIYGAGAGYTNAATAYNPLAAVAPYLGAASQYNAASASQPWLNQAANYQGAAAQAGSPQGIQSYMSPYTNSVVQGIQNQANQNWNQNIMPGVNDKFVGSGQYGSGRNAQVLGQAAGNFQTGLSANVANALESGYNTAGNQAAQQAQLLAGLGGQALTGANTAGGMQTAQISNLLNQAGAAGTATQQQAANLQGAGAQLGNLANTQASAQLASGKVLGDLGNQAATTNLAQNSALQGIGQQQQQLEQSNLNVAQQDFQNQVNYPQQQTDYLSAIIHGLPATGGTSTTVSQQSPAYTASPLAGVGGSITGLLGSLSNSGQKEGGLVGYAKGGVVEEGDSEDNLSPLEMAMLDDGGGDNVANYEIPNNPLDMGLKMSKSKSANNPLSPGNPTDMMTSDTPDTESAPVIPARQQAVNPLAPERSAGVPLPDTNIPEGNQQDQLLALARSMTTPMPGGTPQAFTQGLVDMRNVGKQEYALRGQQNQTAYERQQDAAKMALEKEKIEQGKFTPVKDNMGNVVGVMNTKTGEIVNGGAGGGNAPDASLSGDDYAKYLKSIDPTRLNKAQSVLDGKTILNSYSLKSPVGQQLYTDAMRLDPSFDMATGPARMATRKDFTSGASSKNITSLNTALGHAASWLESANALNNNEDIGHPYNYLKNQTKSATSYPELTAFKDNADALADELTRTFRGTGGSVTEVENWRKNLSPNMSPSEIKASAKKLADLLDSRLDALGTTYQRGMGKEVDPTSFLSPKARTAYDKIHGGVAAGDTVAAGNAPPAGSLTPDQARAELARRAAAKAQGGQ